ncbi:acyltransferase family protein [Pseudaquabacterium pictum]|uniref:Acyltransferase n=1 Tax=Pseudaquabacterium pictum TaxID=2315236 RepID=A0A480AXR6_9BURK|nr:acyltransferase family protein [Rubrivivax pictus]GCL66254.1 acyltransferase [Rubrivivax pictus]
MRSEHRPEIDGLRAVAIVPVVLYHAGVPGFGGGYVGVDVFFVVSGFLITGILLRALQAGQFSLLLFYERRIRRLLPALVAVLVASTAAASWLLFPTELNGFGRSLAATALFLANVHFMRDAGYFAAPAESQPLLHMWSLAVEEQFYLLFPLVLAAGWRWFRPRLLAVMLVLAALSFAYALWLLAHKPDHAFYATPSRAWELLVGVALAMVTLHRRPRRVIGPRTASALTLLGLALICVPVATYSETTRFPGAMALPPVMGAALVLLAAPDSDRLISRLLTNAPVRLTGLMSYSLYLWHWPVIVFCKTLAIQPLTAGQTALMLAAVVALALCSWRFIEQPFRRGGSATGPGRVIVAGAAAMAVSLLVGVGLARGDGFPGRFQPEALALLRARTDLGTAADCRPLAPPRRPVDGRLCKLGAEGGALPSFVVWGDSHAETLFPAFNAAAAQAGASGVAFMRRGCPPLVGVRQLRDRLADCPETAEAFFRYLADHPHVRQVVLVARWAVYAMGHRFRQEPGPAVFIGDGFDAAPSTAGNRPVFERGLVRSLDRLAALGVQVTVVAQVPETEHLVPLALARAVALQRTVDLAPAQQDYQARQAVVEALFQQHLPPRQVAVLRPASVLCPADRCAVVIDGAPVYRDTNHLTRSGALALTSVFQPLFTAAPPGALRAP